MICKFKHVAEAWFLVFYNIIYLCTIMPPNKRVTRSRKSRKRQTKKRQTIVCNHYTENTIKALATQTLLSTAATQMVRKAKQFWPTIDVFRVNHAISIRCWVIFSNKSGKKEKRRDSHYDKSSISTVIHDTDIHWRWTSL